MMDVVRSQRDATSAAGGLKASPGFESWWSSCWGPWAARSTGPPAVRKAWTQPSAGPIRHPRFVAL